MGIMFIPVVVVYIAYVWYKINAKPVTITELDNDHAY